MIFIENPIVTIIQLIHIHVIPIDATFKETASDSSCVLREPITESELEAFLGTLLKMGLVPKPRYAMYWSTELRCDAIADAMSRNSKAVLDRESSRYDRLFKIRPLIESIRQSCLRLGQEEYQSIDEEIILCKGRNKLKQYIPKKPKKWDIKVNARTGVSGLLYDFCFYEGKVPRVKKPSGCLSFDIIMKLCETVPKHRNFKIFFDNYFTHLDLQLRLLKKMHPHHRNDSTKQTEERVTENGERVEKGLSGCLPRRTTAENNICIVRWHDSAVVGLSSTYVCTQAVCKR
ncbi:PiggyBac transposable element-derived protein 3 [Trichinella sp. T9]|nr:PiggyBac transposable element-derived protein 3 [Trichinella sp. T9]